MKFFSKHGVFLIGALWMMAGAPEAFAFSIGELQVKSKFGEKFKASFDIGLDFDGPLEVALGDVSDYERLGLARQDIIEALILESAQPDSGLKKTIQIRSNNPLFFPSFNLVVRATHNGGTLLENFLVTVDFQQSLSLNVREKKKKTSPPKPPKQEPQSEPALSQEKVPQPAEIQQPVKNEPEVKQEAIPESQTPAEPKISDNKVASEEPEVLSVDSVVPVPAKSEVLHRRRLSGVIWAKPRPNPNPRVEKTGGVEGLSASGDAYVLQKGEGLFAVARKVKVGNYHPAQIAAAIWMHNIDKFIFGNIHGIREGVQLDLKNLEEHIASIDLHTARGILKGQAVEWELARNATPVKTEEASTVAEIPLPLERLEDLADLFEQVEGWQTTWENMDVENHLAYYEVLETENPSRSNKKQLLARYPKPILETSSKFMVLKEGVPMVFFAQAFSSESLKSWGLKELEWTRSPLGWKIRGENFYELSSQTGEQPLENPVDFKGLVSAVKALSFVIHVSSHSNKPSAISLTNRLRENGFDAYWAPVRMSREISIYRVYLGRFSDWNQAHRVVRILRKKPFGGHATAIPYPFALQVGEPDSLKDARVLLESIRKSGLSGLLLVSHNESVGVRFRVVVGAFKKPGNATWMLQQLKQSGFKGELISP